MHAVNERERLDPPPPTHDVGNVALHERPELAVGETAAANALPRLAALMQATNAAGWNSSSAWKPTLCAGCFAMKNDQSTRL